MPGDSCRSTPSPSHHPNSHLQAAALRWLAHNSACRCYPHRSQAPAPNAHRCPHPPAPADAPSPQARHSSHQSAPTAVIAPPYPAHPPPALESADPGALRHPATGTQAATDPPARCHPQQSSLLALLRCLAPPRNAAPGHPHPSPPNGPSLPRRLPSRSGSPPATPTCRPFPSP